MDISHGGKVEENLIFAGQIASRFKSDPFYKDGTYIPTIAKLITQIKTGS